MKVYGLSWGQGMGSRNDMGLVSGSGSPQRPACDACPINEKVCYIYDMH